MTFKNELRYLEIEFCENLSEEEMNQVQGGLTIAYAPDYDGEKHPAPEPFPLHPIEPIHPIDLPIHPINPPILPPIHPPIRPIGHPRPFPIHKPRPRPYPKTH